MKFDLSAAKEAGLRPRACFDLGQRVTEVGAALAYADYFAKRIGEAGAQAVRDLSAGIQTAQLAAERLKGALQGRAKAKAEGLEKDVRSFNERIKAISFAKPVPIPEAIELQNKTSELRKRAMEMWSEVRLACPDGAGRPPGGIRKRAGRTAR